MKVIVKKIPQTKGTNQDKGSDMIHEIKHFS